MSAVRHQVRVTGVIQGVGFRPFVHRLAHEDCLVGFVRNDTGRVYIEVEGPARAVDRFEQRLRSEAPPLARVDTVDAIAMAAGDDATFVIAASDATAGEPPLVPPDVAVCTDCVAELFDPTDRRYRHPFITCTNCGPRFTIITAMPYDRPNTTMAGFDLCAPCDREFGDPSNRRHHAQPLCCPGCGPTLRHEGERGTVTGTDAVIAASQADLAAGRIVALKGLGGYHLAVDATDAEAVRRLRSRKARPDKPFAVMVADIASAERIAVVDDLEIEALTSPANPIVLLRARPSAIAADVAPGSPLIGVMLPTTPAHHLLFAPVPGRPGPVPSALVMTSGNLCDEPICFDDHEVAERLGSIADSYCTHDRPIRIPCDDSVVRVVGGAVMPIRRSRGAAPLPAVLPSPVRPILAVGSDLKNTFAVGAAESAWLSQHLGDAQNTAALDAFEASLAAFTQAYDIRPEVVAVDAHPGYRTHRWARAHYPAGHIVEVQHHHAHLASLLAEHGVDATRTVAGFVFDGTGYGCDGTAWGGEILVGSYDRVQRWGHLAPVRLPGGDSAAHNPCRSALAHLRAAGVAWDDDLAPVQASEPTERRVLDRMLRSDALSIRSSSMGRLFDAFASLLGLRHRITYEAQAAIDVEVLAAGTTDLVPMRFVRGPTGVVDPGPVVRDAVEALRDGADPGAIARGLHGAVADLVLESARRLRDDHRVETFGLTGGVWQNALLTELTLKGLATDGIEVLTHRHVPANDGGLALGQVMVAAHAQGGRPCASAYRDE